MRNGFTIYDNAHSRERSSESDGIRLLIVDDNDLARHDIRSVLSTHRDIEIVGEFETAEEAIRNSHDLRPDLILLDIRLPGMSGIEAATVLRQNDPESRVIFVTQHESPLLAKDALLTGALGYVVKSDVVRDLWPAIEAGYRGDTFVSHTARFST